jgi:hypothetical protein
MKDSHLYRFSRTDLFFLLPLIIIYLLYLSFYINWADFFHNHPIHYTDYATHYSSVWSVSTYLDQGHLWGYNPYFHAGFPDGTLFDMDNKGIEVLSWLFSKTSLPLSPSYNLVVLFLMCLFPLMIYLASRSLHLSPVEAAIAQVLGFSLWFGDTTWSWAWQGGMIAFIAVVFGCLLCAGAFWRWAFFTDQPLFSKWFFIWFLLGGLIFWLHPWVFFILIAPFGVGVLTAWGKWDGRRRWLVILWMGWVLLVNSPWWVTFLRFLPDKTALSNFTGGLQQLAPIYVRIILAYGLWWICLRLLEFTAGERMASWWIVASVSILWLRWHILASILGQGRYNPIALSSLPWFSVPSSQRRLL